MEPKRQGKLTLEELIEAVHKIVKPYTNPDGQITLELSYGRTENRKTFWNWTGSHFGQFTCGNRCSGADIAPTMYARVCSLLALQAGIPSSYPMMPRLITLIRRTHLSRSGTIVGGCQYRESFIEHTKSKIRKF